MTGGDRLPDQHLPDQHLPDQHLPDQHLPDQHLPEQGRLRHRLNALSDAATLLRRHGFDPDGPTAGLPTDEFIAHAEGRLRHGTDHTVVALVGSTGSGKSSILNAVAGQEIARAGVTRPTTAVTQAVTFGQQAPGLLDLIGVPRTHHIAGDGALEGLVLLDLPDFDSVAVAHRLEVNRLVDLVDLMLWVTDPQKYGDESLHAGYLRPLRTHADVMQVLLNKSDTLSPEQLRACMADLDRLLQQDGLEQVTPIAASTMTQEGIATVRGILAAEVQAKEAAVARIGADITARAQALSRMAGSPSAVDLDRVQTQLSDGLAAAAGVGDIAQLVTAQYRRDAVLATGWPPARFIRRFRRAPLAQLRPSAGSQVATAEVSRSLRAAATSVAAQAGPAWAESSTALIRGQQEPVVQALDSGISRRVQVLRRPPRWWRPLAALQKLWLGIAVVGGLWLASVFAAQAFLLLDADAFTPRIGQVPLPTVMLLGGLVLGLMTAFLARLVAGVTGRRQGHRATTQLRQSVAEVADERVMDPLATLLSDADQIAELLDDAAAR